MHIVSSAVVVNVVLYIIAYMISYTTTKFSLKKTINQRLTNSKCAYIHAVSMDFTVLAFIKCVLYEISVE